MVPDLQFENRDGRKVSPGCAATASRKPMTIGPRRLERMIAARMVNGEVDLTTASLRPGLAKRGCAPSTRGIS
ncbi:hypothetical protein [Sphingomonas jinjuensis]|uniref:hypothetical protein n=1 Tax=Sphingomonas jinjuensis TaxID=535907 RepID=UPI001C845729|nr:hypothetical protein [Sphingomonas jinjuensis]